jgi:hypothetical protein
MPSFYTLRMQFGPHQETTEISGQLERLAKEACIDEFMFFFFGEEQNDGHERLPQVQNWIEQSRPYRDALKRAGISVSLNPWHSMLHCDRGRSLKPGQDWQRMVDPYGQETSAVVCFLDSAWQEYFFETLRMYAHEGFRVVWIDDDIRYHNHAPLEWGGCFCPLHIAEFNRRSEINAGRSEIVQACLQPGEPHPWRSIWLDMWQETILEFLGKCQSILEGGGTKMGLMSSSMEAHAAEGRRWGDWWQVFGGGKPPVHRPHFWTYSDATGQMLIHGIAALDQNRSIQPVTLESGPEIENFPYGRWNKSFRQTFAQMAVAHILGSTNLNISLYDFMGNLPDDEPERAVFLRSARPNLDWLADQFPMTMKSVGIGVPWSEEIGRTIHTEWGKSWFELQASGRSWAYWLGAAGLAFSARAQEGVNALAGQAAWSIDGDTLQRSLSKGLLLDGSAALILVERGFGKWIGIKDCRQITQKDALYSIEECRDPRFSLRPGGQISVNDRPHTQQLLQANLDNGAEVISELLDPRQRRIGHGAFTFTNELGGKVAVVLWDAGAAPMMDIHRATQLRKMVRWLAGDQEMGSVEGSAWLLAQFLNDGANWRGVVWNAGPDEVDVVSIHCPSGMPSIQHAWHLTWNGERRELQVDGDILRLGQPMQEWDLVVFF